jgi:hypothetical protein
MKNLGVLKWDIKELSNSLKLAELDVKAYFQDGRRISFLLERRINKEVLAGDLAPSEGSSFDLYDKDGNKWEVRSITKGGTYFNPSKDVGSSRTFNEKNFFDKLSEIEGYILCDIVSFPNVPYWKVNSETVKDWYSKGFLGKNARMTREKLLAILAQ